MGQGLLNVTAIEKMMGSVILVARGLRSKLTADPALLEVAIAAKHAGYLMTISILWFLVHI